MHILHDEVVKDYRSLDLAITSEDLDRFSWMGDRYGRDFYESDLPALDDILLDGLSSGILSPVSTPCDTDGFPILFGGLWRAIFHDDLSLRSNPDIPSIRALRQILRFQKKVSEVCSEVRVDEAINSFISTDEGLPLYLVDDGLSRVNAVLHGAALYKVAHSEHDFGHGPGATAERLDSVARWDFPSYSRGLAAQFYPSDFTPEAWYEDFQSPLVDPVGRLEAVPKTFLKPRLISIEPAASIYAQKGVLRTLDRWMATVPQINMRDQSRNNAMARRGSIDGSLATIDLSEASDRVSLALTELAFSRSPSFLNLIANCRTGAVDTGRGVHVLRKFASMGCALTFPVQMLVFRSIAILAICRAEGDLSRENILRWGASSDIGIFGDDIVVPTRYAESVISSLEAFKLKVNLGKSFTQGLFRESCGGDYFAGVDVTPTYLRRQVPHDRHDVEAIVSLAETSIQLDSHGLVGSAKLLSHLLEEIVGSPMPRGAGLIGVAYPSAARSRYNTRLQVTEVSGVKPRFKRKDSNASEIATLRKALSSIRGALQEVTPAEYGFWITGLDKAYYESISEWDPKGLTHHGRPSRAFITRGWAQPVG